MKAAFESSGHSVCVTGSVTKRGRTRSGVESGGERKRYVCVRVRVCVCVSERVSETHMLSLTHTLTHTHTHTHTHMHTHKLPEYSLQSLIRSSPGSETSAAPGVAGLPSSSSSSLPDSSASSGGRAGCVFGPLRIVSVCVCVCMCVWGVGRESCKRGQARVCVSACVCMCLCVCVCVCLGWRAVKEARRACVCVSMHVSLCLCVCALQQARVLHVWDACLAATAHAPCGRRGRPGWRGAVT
jgi:hypothetical protein